MSFRLAPREMSREGRFVVRPFAGQLEDFAYEPLDSTPIIAEAVAAGLARHRRALGLPEAGGAVSDQP